MRERKRMLRLLSEDVTLLRVHAIRIQIRRKGGATTTLDRPLPLRAPDPRRTPAAIVELIRALATEHTDRQVAATLNGRALRSGTGQPFTRVVIKHIRADLRIPSLARISSGRAGSRRWRSRSSSRSISPPPQAKRGAV
jgi:hypothetical protein